MNEKKSKVTKARIINDILNMARGTNYNLDCDLVQTVRKGLNKMTWDELNNLLFLMNLNLYFK